MVAGNFIRESGNAIIVAESSDARLQSCHASTSDLRIVEVVSPSSEGYDRGLKFAFCGALRSLREYLIVEQDTQRIEVRHRRDETAAWQYTVVTAAEEVVALPSLGLELPMRWLYRSWEAPGV